MTILEGIIMLHKITKKDLAAQLGITVKTLNRRLKGISHWKLQDVNNIADILNLKPWQIEHVFNSKTTVNKEVLCTWRESLDNFINTTKYCNKNAKKCLGH